jgi:hypothetical protein
VEYQAGGWTCPQAQGRQRENRVALQAELERKNKKAGAKAPANYCLSAIIRI